MKTKIILEMGCNHQGEMSLAKQMIDDAVRLEVDYVKFQKRDIEAIPQDKKDIPRQLSNSFGKTYYEHRKALEFSIEQLEELKAYTEVKGLKFACSAFDIKSIRDLASIGCEHLKIPSQYFSNKDFVEEIRKHDFKEVIGSTGMHYYGEVLEADKSVYDVIMHCISVYPNKLQNWNIDRIRLYNRFFDAVIGYSSHDLIGGAIYSAIIAGAEIVERHYTLNKTMKGSDHKTVSSDYKEMEFILSQIKAAEAVIGDKDYNIKEEIRNRKFYR